MRCFRSPLFFCLFFLHSMTFLLVILVIWILNLSFVFFLLLLTFREFSIFICIRKQKRLKFCRMDDKRIDKMERGMMKKNGRTDTICEANVLSVYLFFFFLFFSCNLFIIFEEGKNYSNEICQCECICLDQLFIKMLKSMQIKISKKKMKNAKNYFSHTFCYLLFFSL